MRRIATLSAVLATAFAVTSAQAVVLLVDDFATPAAGVNVFDNTGAGDSDTTLAPTAFSSSRTITHTLATAAAIGTNATGLRSSAGLGGLPNNFPAGQLNMANGNQVDSNVSVEWTLNSIIVGSPASFFFDVVQNNVGTPAAPGNKIEAFLDNVSIGTFYKNTNTASFVTFTLSAADITNLASTGTLFRVDFSGDEGWDMAIDTFGLTVPEPTSLALVGLALVGAGVASRRRKA
jgi:hypothetical protein